MATDVPEAAAGPRPDHWLGRLPPAMLALIAGLIGATLDFSYAVYLAHGRVTAGHMMQGIASGLLGRRSYEMGLPSMALGLACHYGIVIIMAFTFLFLSRRLPWLRRNVLKSAVVYGLIIYVTMEFVVVPLSAAPFKLRVTPMGVFTSLVSHICFVALPIAYLSSRANWRRTTHAAG